MSEDVVYLEIDKRCDGTCTCPGGSHIAGRGGKETKYCCTYYANGQRKVTVTCEHTSLLSIPYHKHSPSGPSVVGIKYNSGDEKNITLDGPSFPLSDVRSVSVFYCNQGNPVLICIEENGQDKWYKKPTSTANGDEKWTKVDSLYNKTPEDISNNFSRHTEVLKDAGCSSYGKCPCPHKPQVPPKELEENESESNDPTTSGSTASAKAPLWKALGGIALATGAGLICLGIWKLYSRYYRNPLVRLI
ncbi:hypothetical protein BEWA_002290 [Theileria equi strain WA]|uniref:Uncharacterized protein n=1 Tax=Theileria equi strain WA TaxID=1537102 RepID=L0AZ04_THEEQ|nr:hypothetical protein BEWA_002290 [Theileria equi strain WA]AFZ80822.1 hypothetical protein BEWA_002290 [Theileria equi strain WA]|eukprot:XP_004830488.1 hypothetical protein BEWA_002290 [Theileria equi strain WA]